MEWNSSGRQSLCCSLLGNFAILLLKDWPSLASMDLVFAWGIGKEERKEEGMYGILGDGGGGVEAGLTTVNGTITNRIENCQN